MAGELGEAEIDQAMELTDTVAEVGDQAVTMADQFAQFVGGGIRQRVTAGRFWAPKRAMPSASMESVLVRPRSSPAKRRVRNGLSNATA